MARAMYESIGTYSIYIQWLERCMEALIFNKSILKHAMWFLYF